MRGLVFTVCLLAALPMTAQASDAPNARTQALIAAFKAVKIPAEGAVLPDADREANAKTFAALDGFFDHETLVSVPVEPHLKAFEPAQLAAFKTMFWDTIRRIAYPNSGQFFREAKWSLEPAKIDGNRAHVVMSAILEAEDLETEVTFHWHRAKPNSGSTDSEADPV